MDKSVPVADTGFPVGCGVVALYFIHEIEKNLGKKLCTNCDVVLSSLIVNMDSDHHDHYTATR